MAILVQSGDPGREETPPRLRENLRRRPQRAAAATEFARTLDMLDVTQLRIARLFGTTPRTIRRWRDGTRRTQRGVDIVLRLLAAGAITVAQVEEAAADPAPARANGGGAKGEPPAPRHAAPAPKQPALAPRRARTATLADPSPTTSVVEQVCALTSGTCRWPLGVPGQPGFRFCNSAVVTAPYCPRHRAMAYLAPRPGRGHGAHVEFVTYGRHGRPSIPSAFSATGASQAPKILLDRAGDLPGGAPPPA